MGSGAGSVLVYGVVWGTIGSVDSGVCSVCVRLSVGIETCVSTPFFVCLSFFPECNFYILAFSFSDIPQSFHNFIFLISISSVCSMLEGYQATISIPVCYFLHEVHFEVMVLRAV